MAEHPRLSRCPRRKGSAPARSVTFWHLSSVTLCRAAASDAVSAGEDTEEWGGTEGCGVGGGKESGDDASGGGEVNGGGSGDADGGGCKSATGGGDEANGDRAGGGWGHRISVCWAPQVCTDRPWWVPGT